MAKSSIEYAELSGLKIALGNLEIIDVVCRDEDWIAVTEWMKARIKQLSYK